MEFIYLNISTFQKRKGKLRKIRFYLCSGRKKNCKKILIDFFATVLQFFYNFPFNFGKINTNFKIPFPRPREINQERSKY